MHIDEILDAIDAGEHPVIGADWAQGRTLFGGLSAAVVCRALGRGMDPERRLRCLEIGFARPFLADEPWRIDTETVADGRNLTMATARLMQHDKPRVLARADYVAALPSALALERFDPPPMATRQAARPMERERLPNFYAHFEGWLATPAMPFSGAAVDELGGYTRFARAPRGLSDAHLVCLVDAWPPTVTPRYDAPRPLSTVAWTLHLADPVDSVAADAALGYHARVHFARDGISSSSADIWAPDGRRLARSTQTSIVYG